MNTRIRLGFVLFLLAQSGMGVFTPAHAGNLKPFCSDGCTLYPEGLSPDKPQLWRACCTTHDLAYWQGGTREQRKQADQAFRACISATQPGAPANSWLMWAGVRVFASPYWPVPFRWGFGWPYFRAYQPLTAAELAEVESKRGNLCTNTSSASKESGGIDTLR